MICLIRLICHIHEMQFPYGCNMLTFTHPTLTKVNTCPILVCPLGYYVLKDVLCIPGAYINRYSSYVLYAPFVLEMVTYQNVTPVALIKSHEAYNGWM